MIVYHIIISSSREQIQIRDQLWSFVLLKIIYTSTIYIYDGIVSIIYYIYKRVHDDVTIKRIIISLY